MNLKEPHRKVLKFLGEEYSVDGICFMGFDGISQGTGLDRKQVRRSCRFLTRKGLLAFGRGLWTEDGEPIGSGYGATKIGAELAETL